MTSSLMGRNIPFGATKENTYSAKVDEKMNSKTPIKTQLPLYKALPTVKSTDRIKPRGSRRVYIETYGCQMNVSDSELMAGILIQNGYEIVDDSDTADVVLLNTCAIRENAETKILNRLKHLNQSIPCGTTNTDLHHVLSFARKHTYTTAGRAWQQLIASLVFETKVDLSLVQEFDEQDQARFMTIMNAFMSKDLRVEEISAAYLELFQHPEDWRVEGGEN